MFNESELNPLPLDIEDELFGPMESAEDAIDTAAATLMDEHNELGEPEDTIIWLPHRDPTSSREVQTVEMEVTHAHAVEQIVVIRDCIGEKSVLITFRVRRNKTEGQSRKGRAWEDINKAHNRMVAALTTYRRCYSTLYKLPHDLDGMDEARRTLEPIDKDDIVELKDATIANRISQQNDKVAWFWGRLSANKGEAQYLEESKSSTLSI